MTRRVMIVAVPVDDENVDVFHLASLVTDALESDGIKDREDDSQSPTAYEDVPAMLTDLGVKVPKWMRAGQRAMVNVEHYAPFVGADEHKSSVRLNQGDRVDVIEWAKGRGAYRVKSPVGPEVWVKHGDLSFSNS